MPNSLTNLFSRSFRDAHRSRWHQAQQVALPLTTAAAKIARMVRRPALPNVDGGKVYLHLGCGDINHPKFINIDALPAPHVHYIGGIEKLPRFKDQSVNLVYASHALEHISHLKTDEVLNEWYRVLRHGGILRISVPNFDCLLDIYQNSGSSMESILGNLMGGQHYKYNYHKTMFNQASLTSLMKKAGFKEVREWVPGSDELTTFNDFSIYQVDVNGKGYPISLNLEAIK